MNKITKNYISEIKQILAQARQKAYKAVNFAMVEAYWEIGQRIVEEEQQGVHRAAYGEEILKTLSIELTKEFGKGFGTRNLWYFRQFYLTFRDNKIMHTLCSQLSWSHIRLIMRVSDQNAQHYYFKEAAKNNWSVRTLDRNISTLYCQRLLASQKKEPVVEEMEKKTNEFQNNNLEFIKNPSVLEFLGLPAETGYTEASWNRPLSTKWKNFYSNSVKVLPL